MSDVLNKTSQHGEERRSKLRSRTLLTGIARENNLMVTWDCKVRNLSDSGARLELGNPMMLPDAFELDITARCVRRPAHVIWREGAVVGVAFDQRKVDASLDEKDELVRLRAERLRLRARLDQLTG